MCLSSQCALGHTTEFSFQRLDKQYLAWAETLESHEVCSHLRAAVLQTQPTLRLREWALLPDSAVGLMLGA